MIRETVVPTRPGLPFLIGAIAAAVALGLLLFTQHPVVVALCLVGLVVCLFTLIGLFAVAPNEARVLQLFGDYVGTAKEPGLRWANPFYTKRRVSLRVRNFESSHLKVNDHDGSPVEIAAVVVWRVVDTAEAVFEVDDYEDFVKVQSEAALRNLATRYPYDAADELPPAAVVAEAAEPGTVVAPTARSLRGNTTEVADELRGEVQARLSKAGVEVIEARFSHLAYAPEIAGAMLRRQQASAVIAARAKIVEGAVSMVQMALAGLKERDVVEFDEDRKAAMVSNLLVVLCGDHDAQPVVNAGTIHQ